jgi:hypothetical protein
MKRVWLMVFGLGLAPICEPASLAREGKPLGGPRTDIVQDRPGLDDLLGWLPADTETVIVAQGLFPILPSHRVDTAFPTDHFPPEQLFQTLAIGMLGAIREGFVLQELAGHQVALALEGSRRFRPPRRLGLMPYEGCAIIALRERLTNLESLHQSLTKQGGQVRTVAGYQVYFFEEKLDQDRWPLFVTLPRPDLLLCATHRGYLEELLKRVDGKKGPRALPSRLPEWSHVNRKLPCWAVRHYDKANAARDPTTPLTTQKRAANSPDPLALGLVVTFNSAEGHTVRVKYLLTTERYKEVLAYLWSHPEDGVESQIRRTKPGEVDIVLEVKDAAATHAFALSLMIALGRGVYI